jgi:hypothetical protein
MNVIELSQDGSFALVKPKGFLGGDLFRVYQGAVEGAIYDRNRRVNVAGLDKVPTILKRLREADFDVEVTPELAASLKSHTAQLWTDLQSAKERADAVDEQLRKVKDPVTGKGLYLFPFQRIGVNWLATRFGALLADDMGTGKLSKKSEPVLTPSGWRTMGDLRVGDKVIGGNGQPTEVIGIYPQGVQDSYRVTMTDGATTCCGLDHLWRVQTTNDRFRAARSQAYPQERVMTLGEILKAGLTMPGNTNRKWFVPMVEPVLFLARKLSVQPYVLGALLANGSMTEGTTAHTGTEEQRVELESLLEAEGVSLKATTYKWTYNIVRNEGVANPLTRKLQALGVRVHCHDKFVPEDYLFASVEDRLALLQGLFDNDGTVSKDGMVVEYNTTSPQLAKDVLHLARSLGGSAWMSTRRPKYKYLGEMKEGQKDHRIRVSLPEGFIPFRVASKKAKYVPRSKYPPAHAIDSVVKEGREESVCIRVAAEDHLYVTNDFIVTHNTIQTLAALPAGAAVLVVAPAIAKGVWKREIGRWRPQLQVTVLQGRNSFRWPEPGEVVIINYDILPEMHRPEVKTGKKITARGCTDLTCKGCGPGLDVLKSIPSGVVVVADEAHALKNNKAKRTRKFRSLAECARGVKGRTWLLTATPLLNRPQELWSIYQAAGIAQEAFGSWNQFLKFFNGRPAFYGGFDWGTPEAEVADRMRRVCLRRLRTEVLPELPVKTWRRVNVDVDKKTLKACDAILKEYGGIKKILRLIEEEGLTFETMSSIRHALAVAKIPSLLAMIEDYEEQEEPVVVFSAHRAVVEELSKREGWAVIMGGVKPEERTAIEDKFQSGQLKGVACTIAAGGVAITLTRSHHAVFTDLEWTPALNAQAEDRICRIGQSRGCVITVLQAEHELDERVTELLMRKQQLITATVDEARMPQNTSDTVIDEQIQEMVKAAEEEARLANLPRGNEEATPKTNPKWRQPLTEQEAWGKEALLTLAALDPDRAAQQNDVGFNSADGGVGHSLAEQLRAKGGLTNAQWLLVVKLCKKYHRQVGRCPGDEDEGQDAAQ